MRCPYCQHEWTGGGFCPSCGRPAPQACPRCGSPASGNYCSVCGERILPPRSGVYPGMEGGSSSKNKWVAFFLCLFLGGLGIHRFYVGKIGTGILWIFLFALTSGLWAVAVVVDLIFIVMGRFRDKYGLYLR